MAVMLALISVLFRQSLCSPMMKGFFILWLTQKSVLIAGNVIVPVQFKIPLQSIRMKKLMLAMQKMLKITGQAVLVEHLQYLPGRSCVMVGS